MWTTTTTKFSTVARTRTTSVLLLLWMLLLATTPSSRVHGLQTTVALANYSKDAINLFNNMRAPAALISGGLVPLGILINQPIDETADNPRTKVLKKAGAVVGAASLLSEIIAVTYASIAINKLVELPSPDTASVADLISKHHELAWLGTNIHFLLGIMGFGLLVGIRVYTVMGNRGGGNLVAGLSLAFFLQSLAIVNRGISRKIGGVKTQFASNLGVLLVNYMRALVQNVFSGSIGVCGILALVVTGVTLSNVALSAYKDIRSVKNSKKV